jgi:gluconokinase
MPVVLALDLGTSFAKALRFDDQGKPVGELARQRAGIGALGRADVETVARAAEAALDQALASGPKPDAVAVSSAWHTLVGVDGDGRATTELSTWIDDRASAEAAVLRGLVSDVDDVRDRVGAPIHPSLPSARIFWHGRHEPDAFAATRRWCSLSEFLASRWFGETVGPSPSIASGTGLYDQHARAWDAELLDAIGLDADRLGSVDDEPRTRLVPPFAERWPALEGVPWFPAIGDGACAVIGSDCTVPGRAALTMGTSAAVRVMVDPAHRRASRLPAALFGYLAREGAPVVGAARSNAGAAVDWAADVLAVAASDAVEEVTFGRLPGGHGLRVDPSIITERSPHWPLAPTARMEGLRRTTTRLDIMQAFVEAVAIGVAEAIDAVEAWAGERTLVLGGGGSASAGWRHLLADVIGRPLTCSSVSDESARGAALAALVRLGRPLPPAPADELIVEPDRARADAFAELRASQPGPPFAASLGP